MPDAPSRSIVMLTLAEQVEETVRTISNRWTTVPRVGLVLGSGLGRLADAIADATPIDYAQLQHFPRSTAIGHRGRLLLGRLAGLPVVAMQGRFHLYEGYSAQQVTLPVRVMKALGIEVLIVTNAAGGLRSEYRPGDLMVIDDHVNLMFRAPLAGIHDETFGPRFPDMSAPYNRDLIDAASAVARRENTLVHRGVYVGMLGPSYETRAEYRMLRRIGGDAVGMSTVPEVIVAVHAGLRVLGISIIANVATPDRPLATSGEEVVAVVERAGEKVARIVDGVLRDCLA